MENKIIITRIYALECVENPILRQLYERAKSGRSQEFLAKIDGCEAGFLSYEDWSDHMLGFIYNIFILPEHRGQGIGRDLLSYSENIAKSLRCKLIQLEPRAFDHTVDLNWLISWYARMGYVSKADGSTRMEKILVVTQTRLKHQVQRSACLSQPVRQ